MTVRSVSVHVLQITSTLLILYSQDGNITCTCKTYDVYTRVVRHGDRLSGWGYSARFIPGRAFPGNKVLTVGGHAQGCARWTFANARSGTSRPQSQVSHSLTQSHIKRTCPHAARTRLALVGRESNPCSSRPLHHAAGCRHGLDTRTAIMITRAVWLRSIPGTQVVLQAA